MQEYNKYRFTGIVKKFDKTVNSNWTGETWAESEKKALSNLKYQCKKRLGLVNNTPIELKGTIEVVERRFKDE